MPPSNIRHARNGRPLSPLLLKTSLLLMAAGFLQGCVGATTPTQQYTYLVVPCDTPGAIQTGTLTTTAPATGRPLGSAGASDTPASPPAAATSSPPVCIVAATAPSRRYSSSRYYPYGYSSAGYYPYGYSPGYYGSPLFTSFSLGLGGGHSLGHFGGHRGGGHGGRHH